MRKVLIALAIAACAVLSAVSLQMVSAQNQTAKGLVEGMLEDILSSEGRRVVVDSVSIALDGDVSASRIEVQDARGAWLVLEDFSLDWQPLSLLSDSLQINALTIKRVAVQRLPESEATASNAGPETPAELESLTDAVITKISIAALEVSEQVAGERFVFSADGSGLIKQSPPEVSLKLTAQRTDGADSLLNADIQLDPASRLLNVALKLKENKSGLVVNLLDIPDEPAVDLSVAAKGSIDNWAGEFALLLDGRTAAAGTARMAAEDAGQRLTVDADGEIGRLVSQQFAGLLGGSTQLVGSILFEDGFARAQVERMRLGNTVLQVRASGPVDWSGTTTDLSVALRGDATRALQIADDLPTLGTVEVTDLRADLHVAGSIAAPQWKFAGSAQNVLSHAAVLRDLNIDISGSGIDPAQIGSAVNGSITARASQGPSRMLPAALLGPFRGQLGAETRQQDAVTLRAASFANQAVTLEGEGAFNLSTGSFDLGVKGTTRSPATGWSLVDRLLSGDVSLHGRLVGGSNENYTLSGWQVLGPALSASLSGTVSETVDLKINGNLPDLSLLHEEAEGSAQMVAAVTGPRSAPNLKLKSSGESMVLAGAALIEPELEVEATLNENAPAGRLDLTATLGGKPLSAQARLLTTPEGVKQLRDVSLVSGSARLAGELSLPASAGPSGRFTLNAPDLNDLGPLFLMKLRGALNARLNLTDADGESVLRAVFDGSRIAGDGFAAARVSGDVQVDDLTGSPRVSGKAELVSARAATLEFDAITATATSSNDDAYAVKIDVKGDEVSGTAHADVKVDDDRMILSVSNLKGRAQTVDFAIGKPFEIVREESGNVDVRKAALRIGSGRLEVDGKLLPDADAAIVLDGLPLSPLAVPSGVRGLSGTVSGRVSLKGDVEVPKGTYAIRVRNLTTNELRAAGLRSLQADVTGRTENRQIALNGTVKSAPDFSAAVEGQIDLSRADPAFDIRASGTADTRVVAAKLAEMGVRLSGAAGFNVRVRGTAERPQMAGALSLSNATLGDADGRFLVTGASGRFEFSQDRLRIVSLRGRSGKSGTVQVAGTVGLTDPIPADVRVRIQNGTYADGTLVHTLYDADLQLSGPLAGSPLLRGQIGLKKTKITLSEVPPTALRPLDVRHRRAPPRVREQIRQIRSRGGGGGSDIRLDLRISALESISVSGRGLSALLGGGLTLSGTPSALVANGSFGLRRGVLKLLGRRLVFESGQLDFERDLDPRLNLVAVSRSSDSTIRLVIAGQASAPTITVTSSPELPQEEALARLVFDRDLLELSPLQVAQLAGSIAVLSGGSNNGVLDGLQDTLGVDWLEITETPSGETAVGIGKQIDERLSIGVEQSTKSATSRVIIDLGVTKNFKLRGAAGSDGSSRAGVIFEKDY